MDNAVACGSFARDDLVHTLEQARAVNTLTKHRDPGVRVRELLQAGAQHQLVRPQGATRGTHLGRAAVYQIHYTENQNLSTEYTLHVGKIHDIKCQTPMLAETAEKWTCYKINQNNYNENC